MIRIRPYESNDIESLTHLMGDLGYPTTVDNMKQRLKDIGSESNTYTFVATIDEKVAGMIGVRQVFYYEGDGCSTQVSALVTGNQYEGRGIGSALIKYVEEWAKERSSNSLYLTSGIKPERIRAHEFYKKQGFEVNGYRFVKKLSNLNMSK
jgi:Acetyltransferases